MGHLDSQRSPDFRWFLAVKIVAAGRRRPFKTDDGRERTRLIVALCGIDDVDRGAVPSPGDRAGPLLQMVEGVPGSRQ
jgi:hypothetical protein